MGVLFLASSLLQLLLILDYYYYYYIIFPTTRSWEFRVAFQFFALLIINNRRWKWMNIILFLERAKSYFQIPVLSLRWLNNAKIVQIVLLNTISYYSRFYQICMELTENLKIGKHVFVHTENAIIFFFLIALIVYELFMQCTLMLYTVYMRAWKITRLFRKFFVSL